MGIIYRLDKFSAKLGYYDLNDVTSASMLEI